MNTNLFARFRIFERTPLAKMLPDELVDIIGDSLFGHFERDLEISNLTYIYLKGNKFEPDDIYVRLWSIEKGNFYIEGVLTHCSEPKKLVEWMTLHLLALIDIITGFDFTDLHEYLKRNYRDFFSPLLYIMKIAHDHDLPDVINVLKRNDNVNHYIGRMRSVATDGKYHPMFDMYNTIYQNLGFKTLKC